MSGWISLHRSIQNHWLYKEKRVFSKYEAWIDLIMMANHEDNKILLGQELILVKKGSRITSIRKLKEKWKWSNTKVTTFLKILKDDGMIDYKSDTKKTLITIVNYEDYQDTEKKKRHRNATETPRKRHESTQTIINNNDNNYNNKDIVEIVDYLNQVCTTNYRSSSKKTQSLINARKKEGFTVQDFKTVIDKKNKEWSGNKEMQQYLRPETLFGTKFESYLNQKEGGHYEARDTEPKKYATGEDIAKRAGILSL